MATKGSYAIWTADQEGNPIDPPIDDENSTKKFPDPGKPEAVDIYFGVDPAAPQPPPKEQVDLQGDIEKVLGAARRLYLSPAEEGAFARRRRSSALSDAQGAPARKAKFRRYFARLFRLAQIGLEGDNASPDLARGALVAVTADLIDDEGGRVKNGHMSRLGRTAFLFALPFAAIHVVIAASFGWVQPLMRGLGVDPAWVQSFMLLWIGSFLGVWLSYGIRTAVFTLKDLTSTDSDRLLPHLRLAFAGACTMVLGMMFALGVIDIRIGGYPVTAIIGQPVLAFLVGVFCGISELTLPSSIASRASAFVAEIK